MLILDMLAIFDVEHGALGSGTGELDLKKEEKRKATLLICLINKLFNAQNRGSVSMTMSILIFCCKLLNS